MCICVFLFVYLYVCLASWLTVDLCVCVCVREYVCFYDCEAHQSGKFVVAHRQALLH